LKQHVHYYFLITYLRHAKMGIHWS
jgi:hypothetical protein